MKIIAVMVISLNGKITRGLSGNIYEWSSEEDREHFSKTRDENSLIVMGSGTYEQIKSFITLNPNKLRAVLTGSPEKYKEEQVEGSLEFSSENPKELVERLGKKYKQMMLVGGSKVITSFLKAGLVDEIVITIEPKLFGLGIDLLEKSNFEVNIELKSIKKLNSSGTLLLKYAVKR